jgi:hypothetical protein
MTVEILVTVRVVKDREVIQAAEYIIDRIGESVEVRLHDAPLGKFVGHYMEHQGEIVGTALRSDRKEGT